jgi:F0F1-type ATP synthase epsilon subunit
MTVSSEETDVERAERHANEAERLLKSRLLSSHVKAQAHAALAVYYSTRQSRDR